MEGENAYFCEQVGRPVTALKRTCIKELPQTLVIHLKRFEYDHHSMQRWVGRHHKDHTHAPFTRVTEC